MILWWFALLLVGFFRAWAWVELPPPVAAEHVREPVSVSVDLDSIIRRDTLRVITRNTAATYFLYRGGELGFEYELAEEFARRLGVHLQMVVPPSWDEVIPWLLQGKGDIVAPGFLMTTRDVQRAAACRAYDVSYMVAVTHADSGRVLTTYDLAGRTVYVRENSPAHHAVEKLNEMLEGAIKVVTVPSIWDAETLLSELAEGRIGATIAPWAVVRIEQTYHPTIQVGAIIGQPDSVAWFVRPNAPRLREAVNAYMEDVRASAFYHTLKAKYFAQERRYARYKVSHINVRRHGKLSPFDAMIQRAARRVGLDWLLVAAQIYQESGFNPRARSWMGAMGLMQLMPRTARLLGVRNPWNPYENISAGVRYLAAQIARFDTLEPYDALAFGLASYNAGFGHVMDARKIAEEEGLDPNKWSGNLEVALLLLSHERYYRRTTYGYVRGSETVAYVNNIMRRWRVYRELLTQERRPPIL